MELTPVAADVSHLKIESSLPIVSSKANLAPCSKFAVSLKPQYVPHASAAAQIFLLLFLPIANEPRTIQASFWLNANTHFTLQASGSH